MPIILKNEQSVVIDADNGKIIERFYAEEREKVYQKYLKDGRWADVGIDHAGDIILWEDE